MVLGAVTRESRLLHETAGLSAIGRVVVEMAKVVSASGTRKDMALLLGDASVLQLFVGFLRRGGMTLKEIHAAGVGCSQTVFAASKNLMDALLDPRLRAFRLSLLERARAVGATRRGPFSQLRDGRTIGERPHPGLYKLELVLKTFLQCADYCPAGQLAKVGSSRNVLDMLVHRALKLEAVVKMRLRCSNEALLRCYHETAVPELR